MKILNEDVRKLFFEEDETAGKQRENVPDGNGVLVYTGGDVEERYKDKVKKVIVEDGVTSIGKFAFKYCRSLTSIEIPSSVTSIGKWAFEDCSKLTSVTFAGGSQCASIGYGAFYGCKSLTSISIPSSVTSIGESAFSGCYGLQNITVAAANPNFSSDDQGVLYNKTKTTLIWCPRGTPLTSITIPSSVKIIGDYAFTDCDRITSITIPSSVTSIWDSAFVGCDNLTIHCKKGSYAEKFAWGYIPVKYI